MIRYRVGAAVVLIDLLYFCFNVAAVSCMFGLPFAVLKPLLHGVFVSTCFIEGIAHDFSREWTVAVPEKDNFLQPRAK